MMAWSQSTTREPRNLSAEEIYYIEFVIERKHGIPSANYLTSLTSVERHEYVTDDMAEIRNDAYSELECSPPSELHDIYLRHRTDLDREIEAYLTPVDAAELERWALVDAWTLEEALALWLGVNPRVPKRAEWIERNARLDPRIAAAAQRWDLINRATWTGALALPIKPIGFAVWAASKPFSFPPQIRALTEITRAETDPSDETLALRGLNEKLQEENKRLTDELARSNRAHSRIALQLFAAVCIEKYKFDPKAIRNRSVRDIKNAIYNNFYDFSEKTVLKYIREAVNELPASRRVPIAEDEEEPSS